MIDYVFTACYACDFVRLRAAPPMNSDRVRVQDVPIYRFICPECEAARSAAEKDDAQETEWREQRKQECPRHGNAACDC